MDRIYKKLSPYVVHLLRECTPCGNYFYNKALCFYFQSIEWRKKSCIDDIESWDPPEVLKKYFVGGHIGYDKEGSPVWIDLAANLDWRGKY